MDNETLKNYLLDELDEPQREAVEELMFANDDVFQQLCVLDDDLVEAYIRGELTSAQSQRLFRRLNASERGKRTLEFMIQLTDRAQESLAQEAQAAEPIVEAPHPQRPPAKGILGSMDTLLA